MPRRDWSDVECGCRLYCWGEMAWDCSQIELGGMTKSEYNYITQDFPHLEGKGEIWKNCVCVCVCARAWGGGGGGGAKHWCWHTL